MTDLDDFQAWAEACGHYAVVETIKRYRHIRTRENDEYACSCGLRWGVGEDDPHTT